MLGEEQARRSEPVSARRRLAAEFDLFEPANRLALVGNNLRLPDERDGHDAHDQEAEDKSGPDIRLANLNSKIAANPFHGWSSPSTAFAIRLDSLRTRRLSRENEQSDFHMLIPSRYRITFGKHTVCSGPRSCLWL